MQIENLYRLLSNNAMHCRGKVGNVSKIFTKIKINCRWGL